MKKEITIITKDNKRVKALICDDDIRDYITETGAQLSRITWRNHDYTCSRDNEGRQVWVY